MFIHYVEIRLTTFQIEASLQNLKAQGSYYNPNLRKVTVMPARLDNKYIFI